MDWFYGFMVFMVKTDNTAYQAMVLFWLGCGNNNQLFQQACYQLRKQLNNNLMTFNFQNLFKIKWLIQDQPM